MKRRIVLVMLLVALIAAGAILLAGGRRPDAPLASPTLAPLSQAAIYRMQVRVYLEPGAIVAAQEASPAALDRVIALLESLEPPAELADVHQQVLAGYRYIRAGRQVLDTTPRSDGAQRAEGEFLVAWGVSRLLEAARQLATE